MHRHDITTFLEGPKTRKSYILPQLTHEMTCTCPPSPEAQSCINSRTDSLHDSGGCRCARRWPAFQAGQSCRTPDV